MGPGSSGPFGMELNQARVNYSTYEQDLLEVCWCYPFSFEILLKQQLIPGLGSPKERPRARKVCTTRVYCTARVGIPGCRSLKFLPSGGEMFSTFKVRGGGGNVGCTGGKLTMEEGEPTPRGG